MSNSTTRTGGRASTASRGRFKFDPRDGFVQVPNFVVDLIGEGLNPQALAVLLYAARHSWRGGSDFAVAKCQADLRISKRGWLYAVLPCLRKLGALSVERLPAINGLAGWRHVFEWPSAATIERAAADAAELEAAQAAELEAAQAAQAAELVAAQPAELEAAQAAQAAGPMAAERCSMSADGDHAGSQIRSVDNSTPDSAFSDGPKTGLSGADGERWSRFGTSIVPKRDHVVLSHTPYVKRGVSALDPEGERIARLLRGERVHVPSTWVTADRLAALVAAGLCSEAQADHLARQMR